MGKIFSVVNHKGGVGKTTVAANLADGLARRGHKVLVVDADAQGNVAKLLRPQEPIYQEHCLSHFLDPDIPTEHLPCLTQAANRCAVSGVAILVNGDTSLIEPRIIDQRHDGALFRLRHILGDAARSQYDYTIIDGPPTLGVSVLESLYAADFAVVPISISSAHSIDGLARVVQLIKDMRSSKDLPADVRFLRLLINRVDRRKITCKNHIRSLQETFGEELIFDTMLPTSSIVEQAERAGTTALTIAPSSKVARAYRTLAQELIDLVGQSLGESESPLPAAAGM